MSELLRRWRGLPLPVRDGVLAVLLAGTAQVELLLAAEQVAGPRAAQHAVFLLLTVPLVLRRLRPLLAAVALAVGMAVQTLLGDAPAAAGFVAMLVVTYSVAQHAERRRDAVLGLLAILASVEVYPLVRDDVSVGDEVANLAIPLVIWVFARLARERLDRAVRAEREAAEQRARAQDALAAERRRIAREMHDVVGHGVTLMLLHAGAAQAGPAGRDPGTAAALDVVLDAGRTALEDLHRLLRVLRDDRADDGAPGTLADLDRLAASAGAALSVQGTPRTVPAAVEGTAYRVVQEALTNARRHAPDASVQVRLRWSDAAVDIEVVDDGRGAVHGGEPGFGLLGMRERVALFDGRVQAGPRTDGPGWRTAAVLPLPAPVPA